MPNIELVEYWSGVTSGSYVASGNTFTFDPRPATVNKDVSVKWRIRRPGYRRKEERGRFRYNEKIQFKITGSCRQEKRRELEWYVKRDSVFKLQNSDMETPHAEQTSDSNAAAFRYWTDASGESNEDVYLIFESAKFTQLEAKIDWFNYTLTLRRVSLTRH